MAIRNNLNRVKQGFAQAFVEAVVPATPVRSGRTRGSWLVSVGSKPTGEGVPDPDGSATIAKASTAISSAKPGEPVNVGNNVPYVGMLNGGSSEQAPAGFIELAFNSAKQRLPEIKAEVARQK